MKSTGRWITTGAALFAFLWAGGALGNESPKNIIMMIGDGFGFEQAAAGRLLVPGGQLVLDAMDSNPGSVNTLNVFGDITDSAASATAYATGCKTENGNVSMAEDDSTILPTSMEAAQDPDQGMATGILSSVYLCDATPGVWLAHAPRRSCSSIIPQQVKACPDVFLGPGEKVSYQRGGKGRNRVDYITDLVENCNYEQVGNAAELAAAQAPNDRLLGIWGGYTLMYDIDQQNDPSYNLPSLAEMVAKAIEVLSRNPNGFFLMVEGGAIDWMAHNKDIAGTARDVVAFDDAVAVAYNFAHADGNTALIVTADHETGGLDIGNNPNVAFIESITASTDFMYGRVLRGEMSAEAALDTYAGVTDLTQAEKAAIDAYGETAISDALSARANVQWILPDGEVSVAPDEGDHSAYEVPVWAYGPGTGSLEGPIDNTDLGKLLFDLVGVSAPSCPVIGP
ncbi:MAG: alkaline phosphatase [Deltaproteobacteria bacterium]|jgi:alkaline phosphatase|nr:alkaline phosphatase [Deltaproteobacteria bacterium]